MPIKVKRVSDGTTYNLSNEINIDSSVKSVKTELKKNFPPKFENGCKLKFNGKVFKSRHSLKRYGVDENCEILMDDSKQWSSSSSSSNSRD